MIAITPEPVIGMSRNTDRHGPESPIQALFELCEFLPVYGGFACTSVYDLVQSTNDLRNKSFICGVFRWSDKRAEVTSCNFRAPIATLGALGNPREVLTHPNCTQIFARPVNTKD